MKKIINKTDEIVLQMCRGIVRASNGALKLDEENRVISRAVLQKDRVCLISGGGSGHEPAHAGFVGKGMLTAAVCGDVFASPSVMQVYSAIVENKTDKGTLLIIKNYTGDRMNFEMAAEMAGNDTEIQKVYVHDDIAVKDSLHTIGRRGVAGTVFVHKIAGAAAELGADLKDVKAVAQKVIDSTRTIGAALTSCTVPAKGTPTFTLTENEMEYGVGIHGEPGIGREPVISADELARKMIDGLIADLPFKRGDEVALLLNGLGATPLMELYVLSDSAASVLKEAGIRLHKVYVGNYITSLDMAGASLTMLRLDDELKNYLDYPAYRSLL